MTIRELLKIDPAAEADRIAATIRGFLRDMKKRGAVLGLSGGVDSSVTAALCARACGPQSVLGIFMPETDSSPVSMTLGRRAADALGIRTELEDISEILRAAGCYRRRDAAIRSVIPEYGDEYGAKIVLPDLLGAAVYPLYSVVVRSPAGEERKVRLPLEAYLAIVAATNFKQRTRKMMEYYHADRLNYAVAGTPNRLESDQGFFVKNGDGAADFKPIAHLYKSQVYALAQYLKVPPEIVARQPTTDTYSLQQSQEEFYFTLPYEQMDIAAFACDHGIAAADAAAELALSVNKLERVYQLIESRKRAARYLHMSALLCGELPIGHEYTF